MFNNSKIHKGIIKFIILSFFAVLVKSSDRCINADINVCLGLESIPISKYKVSKIRSLDYYLDPNAEMKRESYPDELAVTMLQAKGLCSYGGSTLYVPDIPDIRYALSYNCYYAYKELQCDDEEKEKTSSKIKKNKLPTICKRQCYEFYNSMVIFLNNNDLCPFVFSDEYVSPSDVYQARVNFTDRMREICDEADNFENCLLIEREKKSCGE